MSKILALAAFLLASTSTFAQECGSTAACEISDGSYHLRLPTGDGPYPVLIWFHGHRGNGATIHRDGGLQRDFLEAGYALLAPNGFQSNSGVRSYPARDGAPRDDVAFTLAALEDAQTRGSLDMGRIFAGGFSAGGSMAWLLACEAGDRLAGMVSVAGALRRPNTTDCSGLAGIPIMHVHGFSDGQVPFEGRQIRDWHQGSLWDALEQARKANGCRSNPDTIAADENYRTRLWNFSCTGAPVRLDLHDGGHGLPKGWTARARRFLEAGSVHE